ncbi:MAG TPA: hypothetical protein VJ246_00830 [Patescibacteria group bacterium]|nr:hypothetical protein [Patescibacteria group bacterium]
MKRMRIFISKELNPLMKLLVSVSLADLTEDERQQVVNGETIRISADEMLARKYGTTSFM